MLDVENFFIQGRAMDDAGSFSKLPKAVAAYSSKFKANERVDTMYIGGVGDHYGLNLPEGKYDLLVFVDSDADGAFRASEVAAQKQVVVDSTSICARQGIRPGGFPVDETRYRGVGCTV